MQHRDLASIIGQDILLSAVVEAMVDSKRKWTALTFFGEDIISQKEAADRIYKIRSTTSFCGRLGGVGCLRASNATIPDSAGERTRKSVISQIEGYRPPLNDK